MQPIQRSKRPGLRLAAAVLTAQWLSPLPAAEPVDEVVITGSHIRGAGNAPAVNVQTIDRTVLETSGGDQVADLLKAVPSNTGSILYNETGQLTGTAQFELRGLGFSSTLTLLNGRRAGVAPLTDKSGADFVDINQFPLAMIERIDVMKDGASAIYGSEAVAGVINLITRKGFEGLELSANYTSATNDAYAVNLATGHRFERGSVNLYATYYGQSGNVRSDFPWLIERIGGNGVLGRSQLLTANGYPGTYSRATTNAAGNPIVPAGAITVPDANCEAAGGVFSIGDNGAVNRTTCRFNFVDQIGVIPKQRRLQSFFEADYQLAERLTYFNETSASRNTNDIYKQPGSYTNGPVPGGLISVPANHPFNFFVADPGNLNNILYIGPAAWNPQIHQAVALAGNIRPEGPYFSGDKRQSNTNLRMVNGFDLKLTPDWITTLSHAYAYAEYQENDPVRINAQRLNSLIQSGTYNPFATSVLTPTLVSPRNGSSTAGNSAAILNQVFYTANIVRRTEQQVVDLSTSAPVLDLPTGAISVAVGGQYRIQSLKYLPDSLSVQGLSDSPAQDSAFSGSQRVWAGYAEALIPVYERAQLQLAVRHEDYGSGIGSSTDPKVSGRLKFFDGALGLRASWGTSFQAPTLSQNDGATSRAFVIINDPVALGANGLTCGSVTIGNNVNVVTTGGNLTPQSSENFNFGVDVKPIAALKISADIWRYNYKDLIAAGQNGQSIVSGQCVNGVYVNDPRVVRGGSGQIFEINTAYVNVGKVVTDGLDLAVASGFSLGRLGELSLTAEATFVNKFDIYGANGAVTHAVGSRNFNNNFAPMPEWRTSAQALWTVGIQQVALGLNFADGYTNDQSNNAPVDSFTTVDAQYGLSFDNPLMNGKSEVRVGVNNLFDREPPSLIRYTTAGQLVSGTVSDVDRPGYDPLAIASIQGRIYYLRISHTF